MLIIVNSTKEHISEVKQQQRQQLEWLDSWATIHVYYYGIICIKEAAAFSTCYPVQFSED